MGVLNSALGICVQVDFDFVALAVPDLLHDRVIINFNDWRIQVNFLEERRVTRYLFPVALHDELGARKKYMQMSLR